MTTNWIPDIKHTVKPVYLTIASRLADDIASGRLKTDDRLPTIRDLSESLGVAIGTVTRAYAEAEKRGLIIGKGRRGTFVGDGSKKGSHIDALVRPVSQAIDFGSIHPLYNQDPDLSKALKLMAARSDINNLLRYPPPQGNERHRQAGVRWISRLGRDADPDSVIICAGGQNGLFLILSAMTNPGDPVLCESLVYPGVKSAAEVLGLKLVGVDMDEEGIMPEALERSLRKTNATLLYLTPDLQNPTTGTLSEDRRRAVADIARAHNLYIIEDAIHRPLLPEPPALISALAPDRTFLLAPVSKTVAGGLRVGFITGPEDYLQSIHRVSQTIHLAISPLSLEVFAAWLEDGTVDDVIADKQKQSHLRQLILGDVLRDFNVKTDANGYFSWLMLPPSMNRTQFAINAHQQGVNVSTAEVFAVPGTHVPEAARICLSTPYSLETVQRGLEIIRDILNGTSMACHSFYT